MLEKSLESNHRAGLSEVDFMSRQRYLENSSCREIRDIMNVASQSILPQLMSSTEVHRYVQEQRDIIDTFRSQPWPMQTKMTALTIYKENVAKYACQMNTIHTFKDNARKIKGNLYRYLSTVATSLMVWNSIIKHIEGRFGSSVASFFTFLRWLCGLNLLMMTITVAFLIAPQIVSGTGLQVPESVRQNGSALSFIVDGKGYIFEYSVLFHGYYDSGRNEPYFPPPNNPEPEIGTGYKLPLAYLAVIACLFMVCKIAILIKMSEKYKFLQKASISEQYLFAWKVFASWDHTVTNSETVGYKQRHLTILLKETIIEAEAMIKQIQWRFVVVRIFVQILVFLALVGSAYAIYLAVENTDYTINPVSFSDALLSGIQGIWLFMQSFQVQAVIVVRNFVLPYIFQLAQFLERHHPRTALKLMLVRLFVLYMTSLYVMIIAFFTFNRQCTSLENRNNSTLVNLPSNQTLSEQGSVCCWETSLGQELYKVSLSHLLAELCSIAFADVFRWAIVHGNFCPRLTHLIGLAEFDLAENILKLVYFQALVWFGVLFCPFLPAFNFFRIVFLFYVRAIVVTMFNRPPRTLFRVASTKTFYMGLLLINVFLCIFPVSYAIIEVTPSVVCGPFRGLPSMARVLTNEIATWPSILQKIVRYTITPTVIIPFIGLQFIIIYYFASLANALKEVNKDVRLQLHLEQKATRERIRKDVVANENYEENISCSPLMRQEYYEQVHVHLDECYKPSTSRTSTSTCEEIVPENVSLPKPPRRQKLRSPTENERTILSQSRRHSSLPSCHTHHDTQQTNECNEDTRRPGRHSSM